MTNHMLVARFLYSKGWVNASNMTERTGKPIKKVLEKFQEYFVGKEYSLTGNVFDIMKDISLFLNVLPAYHGPWSILEVGAPSITLNTIQQFMLDYKENITQHYIPEEFEDFTVALINYFLEHKVFDYGTIFFFGAMEHFELERNSFFAIDEAQDLTPMTIKCFAKPIREVQNLYIAGDVSQSIYTYLGSDPCLLSHDLFSVIESIRGSVKLTKLNQIRRFGLPVFDFSENIISNNKNLYPEYLYIDAEPENFDNTSFRVNHRRTKDVIVSEYSGDPINALFRTRYEAQDAAIHCIKSGIRVRLNINDFGSKDYDVSVENKFEIAEAIYKKEPDPMIAKKMKVPNPIDILLYPKENESQIYKMFGELYDSLYVHYADNRRNFINGKPVTLSTIHSTKGREFDNVILSADIPARAIRNYRIIGRKDRTERCVWYTGATRCKKSLVVSGFNRTKMKSNLYLKEGL